MHALGRELVEWCLAGAPGSPPDWAEPETSMVLDWVVRGRPAPAPPWFKREIVAAYVERSGYRVFIETGTHAGDTTERIALTLVTVHSIELSELYFNMSKQRLRGYSNVTLWLGDSAELVGKILDGVNEPAVFWLDGHYSGGDTALGSEPTPILAELNAIYKHSNKDHIILVDDMRCFLGGDYPKEEDLINAIGQKLPEHKVSVQDDILRAIPLSLTEL